MVILMTNSVINRHLIIISWVWHLHFHHLKGRSQGSLLQNWRPKQDKRKHGVKFKQTHSALFFTPSTCLLSFSHFTLKKKANTPGPGHPSSCRPWKRPTLGTPFPKASQPTGRGRMDIVHPNPATLGFFFFLSLSRPWVHWLQQLP